MTCASRQLDRSVFALQASFPRFSRNSGTCQLRQHGGTDIKHGAPSLCTQLQRLNSFAPTAKEIAVLRPMLNKQSGPRSSLNLVRVECVSLERYDRRAADFMEPCSWPIIEGLLSSPTYPWRVIEGPTIRLCPFRIKLIGVSWKYVVWSWPSGWLACEP